MATKTHEELQELLTEVLEVKENLQSSQTTRLRSLRDHQEQLEGLAELYTSGRWPPGYVLDGQDLFNVISCVQYVLLELQVDRADQVVEEIRQRKPA